ncbi:hypothetical protein [Ornithinimicrobium sp. Y1694]|uniref:hypothetical protein n=1 Tax=Ornithinimicrobium sp. Y1694 TaxID=3418590 RepID=UPI003CEB24CA
MIVRLVGFVLVVGVLSMMVLLLLWLQDKVELRRAASRLRIAQLESERAAAAKVEDRPTGESRAQQHRAALARAKAHLEAAQQAYDDAVAAAAAQVDAAGADPEVGSYRGVRLTRMSLGNENRPHMLSADTSFTVEQTGERTFYTDAEGWGFAPAEYTLTITDPQWQEVVKLTEDDKRTAEGFARQGEMCVRTLEQARREQSRRVAEAKARLETVRADTAELDLARMTYEDLRGSGPHRTDLPEAPDEDPQG